MKTFTGIVESIEGCFVYFDVENSDTGEANMIEVEKKLIPFRLRESQYVEINEVETGILGIIYDEPCSSGKDIIIKVERK